MGQGSITPLVAKHSNNSAVISMNDFAAVAQDASEQHDPNNQVKIQIGSGYVTNGQRKHLQTTGTQQWINQPLAEFAEQAETIGYGTSGISPAVVKHIYASVKQQPMNEIKPQVMRSLRDQSASDISAFGTGSIAPSVTKFFSRKVDIGGGWIAPIIRKHLQSTWA
jgi:hypothetical protein